MSGNNYWSDVAENLKVEEATQQAAIRNGSVLDDYELDTTVAVSTACWDLGISKELAVWSIMEYGNRNLRVHRDLLDLRSEGKFPLLAEFFCADNDDLDSTFSELTSETDLSSLRTIIQTERDTWFDTSDNPDHPDEWIPTTALRHIRKDALERLPSLDILPCGCTFTVRIFRTRVWLSFANSFFSKAACVELWLLNSNILAYV